MKPKDSKAMTTPEFQKQLSPKPEFSGLPDHSAGESHPKQTGSLPMGMENTPQPGDGWLPIESAPRDGTQVLIAGGTVEYDAECFPEDRPFGGVHIASWCQSSRLWSGPYGSEYDAQYWHTPTHWQPLPPPPSQDSNHD